MDQMLVDETEADILQRVLERDEHGALAPEAARFILTWEFKPRDHRRIEELAKKSNQGALTAKERAELERYNRVALLVTYLKSRARQALANGDVAEQRS